MRIKKITASTITEAHLLVEKELGTDAVVLSSRNIKLHDGSEGIEVTAAIDVKDEKPVNQHITKTIFNDEKTHTDDVIINATNQRLISEILSMKSMLMTLSDDVKYKYTGQMSDALSRIYKILIASGLAEDFSLDIVGRVSATGFTNDFNRGLDFARELILGNIKFGKSLSENIDKKPLVVYFVGTSGVGKTSALIKLAVISKLLYGAYNPFIVTTDTYKVGGAEQLGTLASIAGINFSSVYNPTELVSVVNEINQIGKNNIIFIDTVGINPNNIDDINSILGYMDVVSSDVCYLVLSATSSLAVLSNVINKFSALLPISDTIITKLDEINGLGNVVTALSKTNLPLSYFTMGQQIPDDIELASSDKLNDYLFLV